MLSSLWVNSGFLPLSDKLTEYIVTPCFTLCDSSLSAADLVHHVSDLQDPRLLHGVQLPEQRRLLVDVLLRRIAQTIADKKIKKHHHSEFSKV